MPIYLESYARTYASADNVGYTWLIRPSNGIDWTTTASVDAAGFQKDFEQQVLQGYRLQQLNVRSPAPPQPLDVSSLKPVLDVDFAKGYGGFPTAGDENVQVKWANGVFKQTQTAAGTRWLNGPVLSKLKLTNYVFEVEGRVTTPEPDGCWGLALGIDYPAAPRKFTVVRFARDGRLRAELFGGRELVSWKQLVDTSRTSDFCTLRAEVQGTNLRIFLNNQYVASIDVPEFQAGQVATVAIVNYSSGKPVEAEFRRVRVWDLDKATP